MYLRLKTDYDPKITGKRDGAFAVIKNNKSFSTKEQEQIFNKFFIENYKNPKRVSYDNFELWKYSQDFQITYFPRTKNIKENDFMAYGPYEHGIAFMISKRTYDILSQFNLPIHYIIPVKIESFKQDFVLLGLPILNSAEIDFKKSVFYKKEKCISYNSVQEYMSDTGPVVTKRIQLKYKIRGDVISTVEGVFILPSIIAEFEKKGITGFSLVETVLDN